MSTLAELVDTLPERPADHDRTVIVLAVDTPASDNPNLDGLGAAIHGALTAADIDPATQAQFLAYTYDVEEASEGWRPGSQLAPSEED